MTDSMPGPDTTGQRGAVSVDPLDGRVRAVESAYNFAVHLGALSASTLLSRADVCRRLAGG